MSYLKAHAFPLKDETYLDAFFVNRFGRRLYETFFRDYTEKVWGEPCSVIRADWGAQRVKGLSLKRAVAQALSDLFAGRDAKANAERETSLITRFYYPKYGPGQMWETVAGNVMLCGGEVHGQKRVSGVHVENGRVCGVTVQDVLTGDAMRVPCDYFFSTMPIRDLVRVMTPAAPAAVKTVANGLAYRDFLTVGLLLRKLHVLESGKAPADSVPDNWIYIQESDVQIARLQIFNNWSPYLVADPQNTVWLGLEYFANEGDTLWQQKDRELIALGKRELTAIGMIREDDVLDACVLRMKKAYPAYFGSYTDLPVIRHFVDAIPNLYLIGRNGMHRYNNQDHSMLTAMTAVDGIAAGESDKRNLWNINLEMVYHETRDDA
jgi:protoporphyrinogen oxidase